MITGTAPRTVWGSFHSQAVLKELKVESDFRGTASIRKALKDGWLEARHVKNVRLAQALSLELDKGEAEALALATDLGVEIIVMDEHDGRARARAMGIKTVGVLGILLRAKQEKRISSLKDVLQSLRREAGFLIADELYQQILEQAGE